jgi:serine/arginine repetitive matrix protein 2
MYNGIGLTTPRGSGTNGYVQKNLSLVRSRREKVDYLKLEETMALPAVKEPNQEILEHDRKRQIALKCLEYQEELEESAKYTELEIEGMVEDRRQQLMKNFQKDTSSGHRT